MDDIILYHGSRGGLEGTIKPISRERCDFGKGFYLTPDKATATRMAKKKAHLFGGMPTIITYEMDESVLQSDLNIKIFPEKACAEWFLFIDANRDRKNNSPIHNYDIVVGPIADDGVVLQLGNYREGIYTPEQAARLLQDRYLDQQYYFGTAQALHYLHKINTETI